MIEDNMRNVSVRTIKEFDKPVCCVTLQMKNGFTLVETSSCVDPSKYDEEIGKQICLKKLEDKVWFLLGYLLQEKNSGKDSLKVEQITMQSEDGEDILLSVGDEVETEDGFKCIIEAFSDDGKLLIKAI